MLRKILPLMLLLIFAPSDYAFGWRHRCCRRVQCCPCPVEAPAPEPGPPVPNYCLQVKVMDFAGNYDLYDCLTYDDGCPSAPDSPYEDMYYGPKHWDPVQTCPNCEVGEVWFKHVGGGKGPTGNGKNFTTKTAACNYLTGNGGAAGGQQCRYYELPKSVSGLSKDYFFVMVRINLPGGKQHYVGVQTNDLPDTPESASYSNCDILHEGGNSKVLSFDIKIGSETRKGLVWLN